VGGALILTAMLRGTCHEGPQDPGGLKHGELIKTKMAVPPKLRTWIKNDKNGRIDVTLK